MQRTFRVSNRFAVTLRRIGTEWSSDEGLSVPSCLAEHLDRAGESPYVIQFDFTEHEDSSPVPLPPHVVAAIAEAWGPWLVGRLADAICPAAN